MVIDAEPIREALRQASADAIWIHPGVDLRHLTGLTPLALERPAALVVLAVGGLRVLAPTSGRSRAHHVTGDTAIDPARPLLCDFGCRVGGYHSDITRVYLPEDGAAEAREALEIVRAAHDAVFAGLEPGLPAGEADALARRVIEDAGHGEHFIHRTGHGVGLEIHEPPYLRPGNPEPLQAGHVFSVEPGIYVPGRFGVRFENLVHLGVDGPELLNAAPRELTLAPAT